MRWNWSPADVRQAAEQVSQRATWARIDMDALRRWARHVPQEMLRPHDPPPALDADGDSEDVARWVFFLDCVNFCFWTEHEPWSIDYAGQRWRRYMALVASLARGVAGNRGWLEPAMWAEASVAALRELFAGQGQIPMLERRGELLRETGRVLMERYAGRATAFVEAARFDAAIIAQRACEEFPGFRDVHQYRGLTVPILKRAQILAADLATHWRRRQGPTINNLEALTAFADYRIPQMLRHLEILVVHPLLAAGIEDMQLIESSSEQEIELRAVSIHAVECMVAALGQQRSITCPAWVVDEYLWAHSHDPDVGLDHHRCYTIFY